MLFKAAISIENDEKPFHVHVAVPKNDRFLVYVFKFSRTFDALEMLTGYFYEYEKRPSTILEFHLEKVRDYEHALTLPFHF